MSRFLLLLGPSGVGKSTIIAALRRISSKFVYISPYMTRSLRLGETDKISVTNEEMDELVLADQLVTVNTLFGGIRYGTPRSPIVKALQVGNYPILDWPVDRLGVMREAFPHKLFTVYLSPPSIAILHKRISKDGRDPQGLRFIAAQKELECFWGAEYRGVDLDVVSEEGNVDDLAERIFRHYISSF